MKYAVLVYDEVSMTLIQVLRVFKGRSLYTKRLNCSRKLFTEILRNRINQNWEVTVEVLR